MHVPRRHSRRLLPPGWVALGFLLLLGCQALLAHRRQTQKEGMMQLAMMPLKQDTAIARLLGKVYDIPYMSSDELDTVRDWHTIDYRGQLLTDSDNRLHLAAALQAINNDTAHEGGVRIRLHEHATYTALVEALDMMNIYNQQKYFLDINSQPVTLYAITTKVIRPQAGTNYSNPAYLGCCACPLEPYELLPPPFTLRQAVSILRKVDWQPPAIALLVICFLVIYQLIHSYRFAR